MITFFLFLLLLDIQRPPKPETPFGNFVVNDGLDNSALTGCTMNPSSGGANNVDMIHVDQHAAGPQFELPLGCNNPFPLVTGIDDSNNIFLLKDGAWIGSEATIQAVDDAGAEAPIRDATASCPEPPTAAILTLSAAVLLYLIFGRKRQKLHRR